MIIHKHSPRDEIDSRRRSSSSSSSILLPHDTPQQPSPARLYALYVIITYPTPNDLPAAQMSKVAWAIGSHSDDPRKAPSSLDAQRHKTVVCRSHLVGMRERPRIIGTGSVRRLLLDLKSPGLCAGNGCDCFLWREESTWLREIAG